MMDCPGYRQIGVLGSGRVARALATGLGPHSAAPILLWGRTPAHRHAAVAQIGRAAAACDLDTLVESCDLVAIAVADDAIAPLVGDIAHAMPEPPIPFVFHVSGRSGAAILDPLRDRGTLTAAIHPVMSFTGDPLNEVARMAGARFTITASGDDARRHARNIVHRLDGIAVEILEEHRPLYHAALCHAANHLVTLLDGSSRALTAAGIDDPYALLAPLVRAALENSLDRGFSALSGPLLRGDGETIRNHLAALSRHCPQILPAYRTMALATLDELERTTPTPPSLRRDLS